jgi:hypothetical protein
MNDLDVVLTTYKKLYKKIYEILKKKEKKRRRVINYTYDMLLRYI